MADAVTIQAQARDPQKNKGTGSRVARRLRAQGRVPAIVYGHKQAPQPISLAREAVGEMIRGGNHLAQLDIDGATEMVLVRDVQWDHLGREIIHLDFARVSADERIETEVPLVLHGTAPGLGEGGTIDQPIHSVRIKCAATAIPQSIRIEVGGLHLNQGVHVRELVLPEGVTVDADPELLLVHVVEKRVVEEPEPGAASLTQPEVIRREESDKGQE